KDAASPVWPRLVGRLSAMLQEDMLPARGAANIFWANGILSEKVRECDELLMELAGYVERHVGTMNPQELSSCFVTGVK
ncbi:unnamed protein product, partial [Symbiodinium natans]